jgi:imidazolonepropionase-like amidohydrolase
MSRVATWVSLVVFGLVPLQLSAQQAAAPASQSEVLLKHAVVMTVTHGNVQSGEVYIKDGKIAAVGKDVSVPAGATVIDAEDLTPRIIDSHSHIALDDDVNEAPSPVTQQMMMRGKITALGTPGSLAIPKDAPVIDVAGMTVYPGLIDSESYMGLTEISAESSTNDLIENSDAIMPHISR